MRSNRERTGGAGRSGVREITNGGTPAVESVKGIQKYIRTEILGIYGAPNYINTRKSSEMPDKKTNK